MSQNNLANNADSLQSVSYTHLDVYKRQHTPSLYMTVSSVEGGEIPVYREKITLFFP